MNTTSWVLICTYRQTGSEVLGSRVVKSGTQFLINYASNTGCLARSVVLNWAYMLALCSESFRNEQIFWIEFYTCCPNMIDVALTPSHHNISMHCIHAVLWTFPEVLTRRICLTLRIFFSWWSFPLVLRPYCVIQGWHCKENEFFLTLMGKGSES